MNGLSEAEQEALEGAVIAWARAPGGMAALTAWPAVEESVERILAARVASAAADREARLAITSAVEALLRTADRPSRDCATARVNAQTLDQLRAALSVPTEAEGTS